MGSFLSTKLGDSNTKTETKPNQEYNKFIEEIIQKNRIAIFSKSQCSYCTKAKTLLDGLNMKYYSIELDVNKNCPNDNCVRVIQTLIMQTQMKTVPQIFINGKLIGGYTDLEKLASSGKLKN